MSFHRSILVMLLACLATPAPATEKARTSPPEVARAENLLLHSTSSSLVAARETAGPDTFALFGGPDAGLEGKFETADGQPDLQGFVSVDLTDSPVAWQVSTFNAENLNGNGPGNLAMWCGQDALQQPGWATAPGYGNNWRQEIRWMSAPVADPAVGQTVDLDFAFNLDLEAGWDFFEVDYERLGDWITAYSGTGTLFDVQYSTLVGGAALPIEYGPDTYGGESGDRVHLRLRVLTDAAWSDEDGGYASDGAVQIDDVSIQWSGGTESEDFEGAAPHLFQPRRQEFFGDFASVLILLTDVDPCRGNTTPGVAFIDHGQEPVNGPSADGVASTGGSTNANIAYGVAGHFVVNVDGGLTPGDPDMAIKNMVVSPEIPWNLPGAEDDGDDMVGAMLCYDIWNHLPDPNLIGAWWGVRTRPLGGSWGPWRYPNVVFLNTSPEWDRSRFPIGDMVLMDGVPDLVQFRIGVYDLFAASGFYGPRNSTPGPVFDNVALLKYRVGGPAMSVKEYHLANDGFPRVPVFDVSTQSARDQQDVAFDMASETEFRDNGLLPAPGDSVAIEVVTIIPGTTVDDIRMVWALQKNPVFEDDIRTPPAGPRDENVTAGAQVWTGEVVAGECFSRFGTRRENRWHAEVPDVDFMYPGDVLHYYFQATDDQGRVTTLPGNVAGFLDFSEYGVFDNRFTVRALPSVHDASGTQPGTLVIYDGEAGQEQEVLLAFRELGASPGVDFDLYQAMAPEAELGNGIGAFEGHGANLAQLEGYENILYLSGTLQISLSPGPYFVPGEGDDQALISAWSALPGTRRIAYFGDSFATLLNAPFTTDQLGLQVHGYDARDAIEGQTAPRVAPAVAPFMTEFVAAGGCFSIADFDHIQPAGDGYTAWNFLDANGAPIAGAAAAVMRARPNGFDVTFPIAFHRVRSPAARRTLPSARASLLAELFELQADCAVIPCTGTTPDKVAVTLTTVPNPFNPITVVHFTAAKGSRGSVKVYNLRGELVRTLHSGEFRVQEFPWKGMDDRGRQVGSGVYLVHATDGTVTQSTKVALVK